MGYYIYRYVHPDYPWLYVGQTIDLEKRIKSHDSNNGDNISRKYENLLKESKVLYFEVNGKNQMDYVESFLIDRHKPYLNKKDKFVDRECAVEMKLPTWQIYRDRDSSIETSTKDFLKILKKVEEAQEEIETKKKTVSDLEKEIEIKNKQLKEVGSKLNALTSIVPPALHPTENIKNEKSIFVDVKFIKEFYKVFPDSDAYFTSINYSETGKVNKCTINKEEVAIVTRGDTPQIYKRKDDDYGVSWGFAGDILINSYACFSRFKPSTPLITDIMLSYYADQILKVKKELYAEHQKIRIFPYKEIKQSGNYTVFNSTIPVEEIYKDRSREGAHNITGIIIEQHDEKLDWDYVHFREWKGEHPYNAGLYNKQYHDTSSAHPAYKEDESNYYKDLLKIIKEGDFFVLRDEDYEKCYELESELHSLEEKMKELSGCNEDD